MLQGLREQEQAQAPHSPNSLRAELSERNRGTLSPTFNPKSVQPEEKQESSDSSDCKNVFSSWNTSHDQSIPKRCVQLQTLL